MSKPLQEQSNVKWKRIHNEEQAINALVLSVLTEKRGFDEKLELLWGFYNDPIKRWDSVRAKEALGSLVRGQGFRINREDTGFNVGVSAISSATDILYNMVLVLCDRRKAELDTKEDLRQYRGKNADWR